MNKKNSKGSKDSKGIFTLYETLNLPKSRKRGANLINLTIFVIFLNNFLSIIWQKKLEGEKSE